MSGYKWKDSDLEAKGYTKDDKGNWVPPLSGTFIRRKINDNWGRNETLVVREPVKETHDFEYNIKTEWFIQGYSVPSKKNSRQNFVKNGKQISIPSKKHAEYKKMTQMQYATFAKEFKSAIKALSLSPPFRIEFLFIRATKHRFDYCNAAQTCEDIMVENGWIEDDSADFLIPSFAQYLHDSNNPGV